MSDDVIPDPENPTTRAINSQGELLSGLFWAPSLPDEPTIAELDDAIHVGWVRQDELGGGQP